MAQQFSWWQSGIIYQVYPRSFQDSNGDGIGDLDGIISRLDYLKSLNVDAIWISPVYPSPMADFGYDVSDYTDIDPMFGTLESFDRLLHAAHARGLKVIMDFVPNHTSERHPWFLESRSSRSNPKRDWYIWHDPAPDGGPPNNWISEFSGPHWQYDEETGQYYCHKYLKEQPDLNWRNPLVREAMLGVMRFWLQRGVDGFRVDAAKNMIKDDQFRDNPPNPDYVLGTPPVESLIQLYDTDRPEIHPLIRDMRHVVDAYSDRMMVGEIYLPLARLMKYHGETLDEFQLVYNFQLISLPWEAPVVRQAIEAYESALPHGAWPNWVLGNHDRHRVASRVGAQQARLAQLLLLTLRGTPTCYYGDELGMTDVEIPPDLIVDPWDMQTPGLGLGRDPERTPMQWDAAPYAGFSTAEPWLPIAPDYAQVNVEVESRDAGSLLSFFRRLTALRRATPALSVGRYVMVAVQSPDDTEVLAYLRNHGDQSVLVVLNFTGTERTLDLSHLSRNGELLLSTEPARNGPISLSSLRLGADEGVIIGLL